MYTIYTVKVDGNSVYVGCTKTKLNDRWRPGKLREAFGSDAIIEPVAICKSERLAKCTEAFFIAKFDTYNNGSNKTPNGQWGTPLGKKRPEHRKRMLGKGNPMHGKKRPDLAVINTTTKRHRVWQHADKVVHLHIVDRWTYKQLSDRFECGIQSIRGILKAYRENRL